MLDEKMGHTVRQVSVGTQKYTQVVCLDLPGAGGACHEYQILDVKGPGEPNTVFSKISFQNGPIKEAGVNGCHQEDLIAIAIDRLEHFQKGEYACRENALALTKLEEAMHWLRHRTNKRVAAGTEGTSAK